MDTVGIYFWQDYEHLIHYVVNRFGNYLPAHMCYKDLIAVGRLGLLRAAERFDPTKGAKFETFALMLIRGAIVDNLRSQDWIPRSVYQKSRTLSSARDELTIQLGRDPTDSELATHLKMSIEEFNELLLQVRPATMLSLSDELQIADHKTVGSDELASQNEQRAQIKRAIRKLSKQERKVITLHYFEGKMFKEIGDLLGVGQSRISHIHSQALARLREFLEEA